MSNCRDAAITTGVLLVQNSTLWIKLTPMGCCLRKGSQIAPKATLIKSTLVGDLLILLRKHRIKAALAALAHSRLHKSALPYGNAD
jgi:hypothetical protein